MIIRLLSLYLFLGVIIASIMFVYACSIGRTNHSKVLCALGLSLTVYIFGYLMELNSTALSEMIFWNQIQYFGIPFFSALWLVLGLLYTGRFQGLIGWKGIAIFTMPVLTFILRLTNDSHNLFYKSMRIKETAELHLLYLEKGPWYLVQSFYVLIVLIVSTILFYQGFHKSEHGERLKFRLLFVASALPYLALVLIILDFRKTGIDYTALVLPVSVGLIILALVKYDFLEIKVMAREKIFEDSSSGMFLLNNHFRVMDYNKACILFFEWFGVTIKEEYLDVLLEKNQELLHVFKKGDTCNWEVLQRGQINYLQISSKAIENEGEQYGFLITIEDITQRELLQQQLTALACSDELSGLDNRRFFMQKASNELERAIRYKENITVAMMDLDHFKLVNDTYGHGGGDYAIREFSKLMKSSFRSTDLIGRMGGEEFAVILLNTTQEEAYKKFDDFRKFLEALHIEFQNEQINLTVSIGIAHVCGESCSIDEILSRADKALYKSKSTGRNRTMQ